ncbi:MAG TPA: protein tyrosine phosphatase family protein [Nostocaceae cyanobacterium]|nr:protein tyrosine phosphatase family protein [Nostocaceae cyanobacterium]
MPKNREFLPIEMGIYFMIYSAEYIYNFLQLTPKIGTSGQPTIDQFIDIKELKYQLVVNLLPEGSIKFLPEEQQIVESLGMEYIHIPVNWNNPTLADLQKFFAVMEANQDKNIFIHCAANIRVAVFMYLYRCLKQGMNEKEAKADLEKSWLPNQVWKQFIDEAMENCK